MDGGESLVGAPSQVRAVGKGTLRQALMLAGAEGALDVVQLWIAERQELEGDVGLGQCRPGAFMAPWRCVEALSRTTTRGWPVPAGKVCSRKAFRSSLFSDRSAKTQNQGRRGSGARCGLAGQHVDAPPLRVLVADAAVVDRAGPRLVVMGKVKAKPTSSMKKSWRAPSRDFFCVPAARSGPAPPAAGPVGAAGWPGCAARSRPWPAGTCGIGAH